MKILTIRKVKRMSSKILKTIEMSLSKQSISQAIREVNRFEKDLRETCWELVKVLTMEGAEIAQMQVAALDAVYTGELADSIGGMFFPSERRGFVIAEAPYAIYVEYGTGAVGAGDASMPNGEKGDPHPEAQGNYDYDVNGHGIAGWVYKNDRDGKWHWTAGYVSRPFMYNTLRWLEEAAPERMSSMLTQM